MSKKANPTVVGAFVLGALLLSILALLLLGGGRLFDESFECVLYFDESVSGLDVGAPVDFLGVRIGTVTDVRLVLDDAAPAGQIFRPVRIRLEGRQVNVAHGGALFENSAALLDLLVERHGLRARLATQSFLTGKLKIELALFPDKPVRRVGRDPGLWEMPTIASPLQDVADEVSQLPLAAIVQDAHRAVARLADLMEPDQAGQTVATLNDVLHRLDSLLAGLEQNIGPNAAADQDVLASAHAALGDFRSLLRKLDVALPPLLENAAKASGNAGALLDSDSPLLAEISRLLDEFRAASQSIRHLANTLEQHPESVLRGKK